jgi:hypothetical protein
MTWNWQQSDRAPSLRKISPVVLERRRAILADGSRGLGSRVWSFSKPDQNSEWSDGKLVIDGEPFNPWGLFNGIYIPEAICKYCGLSLGAKMVYGRFCRYAGRDGVVYPSIPKLASELGIGKTQARNYVQELERELFIAVDRKNRHLFANGTGGSNRYVFLWDAGFDGEQGNLRKAPPVRKTGPLPLLKAELAPARDPGVLTITVTSIGAPDRTIEMRLKEPKGRRRPLWRRNGGHGR